VATASLVRILLSNYTTADTGPVHNSLEGTGAHKDKAVSHCRKATDLLHKIGRNTSQNSNRRNIWTEATSSKVLHGITKE
jgi:hypothetical protein